LLSGDFSCDISGPPVFLMAAYPAVYWKGSDNAESIKRPSNRNFLKEGDISGGGLISTTPGQLERKGGSDTNTSFWSSSFSLGGRQQLSLLHRPIRPIPGGP
jgi:hypothetical protein